MYDFIMNQQLLLNITFSNKAFNVLSLVFTHVRKSWICYSLSCMNFLDKEHVTKTVIHPKKSQGLIIES